MTARTKLGWVDIPRQSLRQGLACGEGGVRLMLLMGDERQPAHPSSAPSRDEPADVLLAEKPR
jgi:hypothetical protein